MCLRTDSAPLGCFAIQFKRALRKRKKKRKAEEEKLARLERQQSTRARLEHKQEKLVCAARGPERL
jgi:hypothetical protein